MADKKAKPDWEKIEAEFRAGSLSVAEIARQAGITHQAIFKRAKAKEWKRDLSERVKERTRQKLVAEVAVAPSEVAECNTELTDEQIVEAASDQRIGVIKLQRLDIKALREEEQRLLAELGDSPTKLWVGQYQGQVIEHKVGIAVTERASALQALAAVQHKRIQLERQAFNIDDKSGPQGEDGITGIKITFERSPNSEG